jgi:hypothetical protein
MPPDVAQAVIGTWGLQSWNTNPMPAKYDTWYGNDAIPDSVTRIAGGSLELRDDATFTRVTNWQIERMDGTVQRAYSITEQGGYTGSVAAGQVTLSLFGSVRMQIAIAGNAMSAKIVVGESPPIVLGDVWRYVK